MKFIKRPTVAYLLPHSISMVNLTPVEPRTCIVDEWGHDLGECVPHILVENIQLVNAWAEKVNLNDGQHEVTLRYDSFVLLDPVLPDPFDTSTLSYKQTAPRPLTAGDIRFLQRQLAEALQPFVDKPADTQQLTDTATAACIMWSLHRNRRNGG